MLLTGLFIIFSIYFAGPLPPGADNKCYLLIDVDHITAWSMVCATKTATTDAIAEFVDWEILHPFGPLKTMLSDNFVCFTAVQVSHLMAPHRVEWKPVTEYDSISNCRAERVVGIVRK